MFDPNILHVLGGMIAGIVALKLVELFVKKAFMADNIGRSEYELFKSTVALLATKEELRQFKLECANNRAACANCISGMKDKQLSLREDLPKEYVIKSDFRQEIGEVKKWLEAIDSKVEAIMIDKGIHSRRSSDSREEVNHG